MKLSLIGFLSALVVVGYAQSTIKKLEIGDQFPDIKLRNVINYKSDVLDLRDFRGKLVILDFWGTTCGACVQAWPKMLELQKKFEGKIQIILIDKYESKEVVGAYIQKRKKLVGVDMTLPAVCADSVLKKMFPENTVPKYGWIDSNGKFMSLTQGRIVNEENINRWITEGYVQLPQFKTSFKYLDILNPLYVDSAKAREFISSSMLTRYTPGELGGQAILSSPEEGYSFIVTNAPIELLYRYAYNENNLDSTGVTWHLHRSKFKLIASDTTQYHYLSVDDGETGRAMYNYQYRSSQRKTRVQMLKIMQQDLDRYFDMDVSWKIQKKKCLVIKMLDSTKAAYKGGPKDLYLNDTEVIFDGVTVSQAIRFMEEASNYFLYPYPIVDATNYKGLLGMRFECNCYDVNSLNKELNKHGMSLNIEERSVKILTVKERKPLLLRQ